MTEIASGGQEIINSLIGNNNKKVNGKFITFYKTFGGLGLLKALTDGSHDLHFQSKVYLCITHGIGLLV